MIPFLLAAGTFAAVNKQVNGDRRIGAIVTKNQLRNVTECNDGSFSTAKHRPCRTRGGVKNKKKVSLIQRIDCAYVVMRPLSKVHTDTKSFQQRKHEYSEDSVQRILRSVENGTFRWEVFDAILLWRNPQNNWTYILSGHSRFEAFKRLHAANAKVGRRGFGKIPAKIIDATYEEAMTIALMSNTLSTPESPVERADYYRTLMSNGTALAKIEKTAKEYEGKNASTILNYMYLNSNGKALNAVRRLQKADATSRRVAETTASWLGQTRKRLANLSSLHEDEMYDYLIDSRNRAKFRRIGDFIKFIREAVIRRTAEGDFGPNSILNLKKAKRVESVIESYKRMVAEKERELREAKRIRDLKLKAIAKRNDPADVTKANMERIMPQYENAVIRAEQALSHLKKKNKQVQDAQKRVLTFDDAFGINGVNEKMQYLKDIKKAIAFYPIEQQAEYADAVCRQIANDYAATNSVFANKLDFKQWNATSVGNLAYICLHSPHEDVKQKAANALNQYRNYVAINGTSESPIKYLPYAAGAYVIYKIVF